MFAVPVAVAAAIGFGTSLSGVAGGLSSFAEGPDTATVSDSSPNRLNRALAALASRSDGAGSPTGGGGSNTDSGAGSIPGGGTTEGGNVTGGSGGSGGSGGGGAPAINPPSVELPGTGGGGGTGGTDDTINNAVNGVNGALQDVGNSVNGLLGQ